MPAATALLSAVWVSDAVPVLLNLTVIPGLAFYPYRKPGKASPALSLAPWPPSLHRLAARLARVATAATAARAFFMLRMFFSLSAIRFAC